MATPPPQEPESRAGRAGAALPRDEELAVRFGVSRTVLREAAKTLTAKGLPGTRSRVGTRVRPRDAWNMLDADVLRWHVEGGAGRAFFADLSEMRLAIEPLAAGLARIVDAVATRDGAGAEAAMRRVIVLGHDRIFRARSGGVMRPSSGPCRRAGAAPHRAMGRGDRVGTDVLRHALSPA